MKLNELFYIGRSEEPVRRLDETRQLEKCNLVHAHGNASIRGAHGGLWMELNEIFQIGRSEEPVRRLDEARHRLYSRYSWRPMDGVE